MSIRARILDALALATLAAAWFALWCILPDDVMATEIRPAPPATDAERMAGLFIAALIAVVSLNIALLAHVWAQFGRGPASTADDEFAAPPSLETRAREAGE